MLGDIEKLAQNIEEDVWNLRFDMKDEIQNAMVFYRQHHKTLAKDTITEWEQNDGTFKYPEDDGVWQTNIKLYQWLMGMLVVYIDYASQERCKNDHKCKAKKVEECLSRVRECTITPGEFKATLTNIFERGQ
jgi:hypothetical protein